ncbi:hypothetical protein VTN00DRAFT_7496 [Thermoascus crustaceus]|uniref:uncharacterized protein n=1 Tax=Thermoascus crustaceus TaxID=5088 RepID=UPI003743D122
MSIVTEIEPTPTSPSTMTSLTDSVAFSGDRDMRHDTITLAPFAGETLSARLAGRWRLSGLDLRADTDSGESGRAPLVDNVGPHGGASLERSSQPSSGVFSRSTKTSMSSNLLPGQRVEVPGSPAALAVKATPIGESRAN